MPSILKEWVEMTENSDRLEQGIHYMVQASTIKTNGIKLRENLWPMMNVVDSVEDLVW